MKHVTESSLPRLFTPCILAARLARRMGLLVALAAAWTHLSTASGQGTAFTYQGRLNQGAAPANGSYDFSFSLYNASAGGAPVAPSLTQSGIGVSNGLFTVLLDFGPLPGGTTYWLEIGVETNGAAPFTLLSPREELTPAPAALYAESATMLANGVALGSGTANFIDAATGTNSFIGGGVCNQTYSAWSVIGGGNANLILAGTVASTIGGGFGNSNSASYATVSGGFANTASGPYATVGGGSNNVASGYAAVIGGGDPNYAIAPFSSVLGGQHNSASGQYATVGGGEGNGAFGTESTIAGGSGNTARGNDATVGGGSADVAGGEFATVSGGQQNAASGSNATVGGGQQNVASGQYGTVPGGYYNSASGLASFAAGYKASAGYDDCFVWSDGGSGFTDPFGFFGATRPQQVKLQAAGGVEMDVAGSSGVNPAALFINSISSTGVGLYVVQTNSSDAAVVVNSWSGDIFKGFGSSGPFGGPNQLVFQVSLFGDVTGHSFNSTSDRNAKENFATIDPETVLQKVLALPISQWNFKGESTSVQHLGPMAQDFHAAFGLAGADERHISLVDESGVALAAIQGLDQKLNEKLNEKDALIQRQQLELSQLKARLQAVEQLLHK